MKDKQLYLYWLYAYIICAILGFIQNRSPLVTALLALACAAFFVPGGILVYRDIRNKQRKNLRNIMVLSIASLLLTMALFIGYWFSLTAFGSDTPGKVMYALLTVFSTPLMCAPFPAISMFLWACLLFTAISFWKQGKPAEK